MKLKIQLAAATVALLMLSSCSAPKKVPYFVDADQLSADSLNMLAVNQDPVITVGDLLNIEVGGANVNALAPFNRGRYIDADGRLNIINRTATSYNSTSVESLTEYYLVNADGTIDFPVLGQIEVAGLTKREVANKIADEIYPKYVTEKPNVDIRLMNFRVTVAGAVKNPGVYQSKNERMTFLEAISLAGDLDIKGDRENILLYRTNSEGKREVVKLNIHDKNFLLSPYFNLKQNDYIYVQPNSSMRASAWQMNPAVASTVTIVGGMSSLASLIIGIINLSKN